MLSNPGFVHDNYNNYVTPQFNWSNLMLSYYDRLLNCVRIQTVLTIYHKLVPNNEWICNFFLPFCINKLMKYAPNSQTERTFNLRIIFLRTHMLWKLLLIVFFLFYLQNKKKILRYACPPFYKNHVLGASFWLLIWKLQFNYSSANITLHTDSKR